jgi:hypothetical protein
VARAIESPGRLVRVKHVPMANTDSCQVHHVGYLVSGRLHVATDGGGEAEIGPGEAYDIQPGHDGWVVGDEPFTSVDLSGSVG